MNLLFRIIEKKGKRIFIPMQKNREIKEYSASAFTDHSAKALTI